jgi:putative hydrolase of the HAD superfamily
MPYHVTWAHEADTDFADSSPRVMRVDGAKAIVGALDELDRRAAA